MIKKVLSAMRPTGRIHLGHYFGVLKNWIKFQDKYECYYMLADLHALTTECYNTSKINENIFDMVADWIAVGVDPNKVTIFRQSKIPQHSELFLILSMFTPLNRLYRCPTYKEKFKKVKNDSSHNYGFLGYPILMSADILLYESDIVPIGRDQTSHIEFTREIAKKFNNLYGKVLKVPCKKFTKVSKLPGLDGRKMSKSYNNSILISENSDTLKHKIENMFTDPLKIRKNDIGHPYGCIVFSFNNVFNKNCNDLEEKCRTGKIGCMTCKKQLIEIIHEFIKPFSENRKKIISDKRYLENIISSGCDRAIRIAEKTIKKIYEVLKF